jgi:hypothetical protein
MKPKIEIPIATHKGEINIGDIRIKCYNLDTGERVLSREGLLRALGRRGNPKYKESTNTELFQTPVFLSADNLKPFISKELLTSSQPIMFRGAGSGIAYGYKADILPSICYVYTDAEKANKLKDERQKLVADRCNILIRGFATIGIIALVDAATGYEEIRDKLALQKILDKYLLKEYAKWAKRFPDEFYEEMFRLRGWQWKGMSINRPSVVGRYTNDLIYERLAPGVLKELKTLNPKDEKGNRKVKHQQYFTPETGVPALDRHLHSVIALMRASSNWGQFERMIARSFPKLGQTIAINFPDDEM